MAYNQTHEPVVEDEVLGRCITADSATVESVTKCFARMATLRRSDGCRVSAQGEHTWRESSTCRCPTPMREVSSHDTLMRAHPEGPPIAFDLSCLGQTSHVVGCCEITGEVIDGSVPASI